MLERLEGQVLEKDAYGAVIQVGGLGLRVEMSAVSLQGLPETGGRTLLYCHLHVREDALQIFAFADKEERALFQLLIGVNKVGPRLALATLSVRRAPALKQAISQGETDVFTAVPGIGKKTAERLILELREKVGEAPGGEREGTGGEAAGADDGNLSLARDALQQLGLTPREAEERLKSADPERSLEELVKKALAEG